MNLTKTIRLLKQHNAWRRGQEIPQLDPKEVGEAIDAAIAFLKPKNACKKFKARWNHSTKPSVFEVWHGDELVYSGPFKEAPTHPDTQI